MVKRHAPYIFIAIILIGLFSPTANVNAQATAPATPASAPVSGTCSDNHSTNPKDCGDNYGVWSPTSATASQTGPGENQLEIEIGKLSCGFSGLSGCPIVWGYSLFFTLPAMLLALSAKFFNFLAGITLYSDLYTSSTFIPEAWKIVRDVSNIFFILILLYIAIETILGIGGHGGKKLIAQVIIMALLINFSMFFTKVVIDTTNILALIFYQKISVVSQDGKPIPYDDPISPTGRTEKDIGGAIVSAFNPSALMTAEMFAPETVIINGVPHENPVTNTFYLSLIVVCGALFSFAAYVFFISGLSFMGRLIELWILIIASPFAFMSFALPYLKSKDYIGWDSWLKRLMQTAFMAPIFMFFLYLIVLIVRVPVFGDLRAAADAGFLKRILLIVIPALIYLTLLLKAASFAKKGAGQVGEALIKGGQALVGMAGGVAGGLALGGLTAGAGAALRGTVGRGAAYIAEDNRFRDWAARTRGGQFLSNRISGVAGRSFDLRQAPGMGTLAKKAGVNLDAAKAVGLGPKEGFAQNRAEAVKNREEFVKKQLDVSDAGKAELTRGGMDVARATQLRRQMRDGGMSLADQNTYYNQMIGGGITPDDLSKVSRYINARRRDVYADRLERRTVPSVFGTLRGPAQKRRASLRIAANKIRESADSAQKKANIAALAAGLAAAGTTPAAATGAAGGGATGGTATGGTGGGTGGGGHP